MNCLHAGFSRVNITPMLGIGLAGYYKTRHADGILDELEIELTSYGIYTVKYSATDTSNNYTEFSVFGFLNFSLGTNNNFALTCGISLKDARGAVNCGVGREIGSL